VIGLLVQNGDIVIGQKGFVEITGVAKIAQDVSFATVEPYGCDRFHPYWGSLLDSYIGNPTTANTNTIVQAEVSRVISNYITVQQSLLAQTQNSNQSANFTNDDLIATIQNIVVTSSFGSIMVAVSILAVSGASITLTSVVAGS
jgi:phage baseplate assembly protein W